MWAAAGHEASSPVLDWLARNGGRLEFREATVDVQEAVFDGWRALRSVFRLWSIHDWEDLTVWLRSQGFPGTQHGNHISARAQEHIIAEACRIDAWVALLEASYVAVVLHMCLQVVVPGAATNPTERRRQADPTVVGIAIPRAWESLDTIDCQELFLKNIPMLKSCPRFLRGRLRECFSFALRERLRGKIVGDDQAELRGWKLFALIPLMLLHKTRGIGSVGRDELAHRIEDFTRGRWTQLIDQAQQQSNQDLREQPHTTEEEDRKQRGLAAMAKIQMGQVASGASPLEQYSDIWWQSFTAVHLRRRESLCTTSIRNVDSGLPGLRDAPSGRNRSWWPIPDNSFAIF